MLTPYLCPKTLYQSNQAKYIRVSSIEHIHKHYLLQFYHTTKVETSTELTQTMTQTCLIIINSHNNALAERQSTTYMYRTPAMYAHIDQLSLISSFDVYSAASAKREVYHGQQSWQIFHFRNVHFPNKKTGVTKTCDAMDNTANTRKRNISYETLRKPNTFINTNSRIEVKQSIPISCILNI